MNSVFHLKSIVVFQGISLKFPRPVVNFISIRQRRFLQVKGYALVILIMQLPEAGAFLTLVLEFEIIFAGCLSTSIVSLF